MIFLPYWVKEGPPPGTENASFVPMWLMTSGKCWARRGDSPITPLLVDDITRISLEATTQGSELRHKLWLDFIYLWRYCLLQNLINTLSCMGNSYFKNFMHFIQSISKYLLGGQFLDRFPPRITPLLACRTRHRSRWSSCLPLVLGVWMASLTQTLRWLCRKPLPHI